MSGDAIRRYAVELQGEAESLPERASVVVRKAAFDTEAGAKALAPVDTGNLRNSITTAVQGDGLRAGVVATASYAYWVHEGRTGVAPRPFLGNATDRVEPQFHEAMSHLAEGG